MQCARVSAAWVCHDWAVIMYVWARPTWKTVPCWPKCLLGFDENIVLFVPALFYFQQVLTDSFAPVCVLQQFCQTVQCLISLKTHARKNQARARDTRAQNSICKWKSILMRECFCSVYTNPVPRPSLRTTNCSALAHSLSWLLRLWRSGWNRQWLMSLLLILVTLNTDHNL